MLYAIFGHIFMGCFLLLEYMGFYLVDGRLNLHKPAKVNQTVRIEVGHANGPNPPFLVGIFHGTVSAVIVVKGLMDQHQINVLRLELAQRGQQGCLCLFIAAVADPHFGRDKQLFTGYAAFSDCAARLFFVAVRLRRINQAIACVNGINREPAF